MFPTNFIDDLNTSQVFIPIHGTTFEQATVYQDDVALVAPCDGRVVSVTLNCMSILNSCDLTARVYTCPPNTSGTSGSQGLNDWNLEETEIIAVEGTDDSHVFQIAFSNAKHFESTEKFAISLQASVDLNVGNTYFYVSTVIEWDYSTLLGASAEYDSAP